MFGRLSLRLDELQSSLDKLNAEVGETLQRLDRELREVRSFVSDTFDESARHTADADEASRPAESAADAASPPWLERASVGYARAANEGGYVGDPHQHDQDQDWLERHSSRLPSESPDRDSSALDPRPSGGFRQMGKIEEIESDLTSLLEDSEWGDDEEGVEIEDHPPRSPSQLVEDDSWDLDDDVLDIEDEPPRRSRSQSRGRGDSVDEDRAGGRAQSPSESENPRSTSRQGRHRRATKDAVPLPSGRRGREGPERGQSRTSRRRKQERRIKARRLRSEVEGLTDRERDPRERQDDARRARGQVEEFDSLLNDYLADDE